MNVIVSNITGKDLGREISNQLNYELLLVETKFYNNSESEIIISELKENVENIFILYCFSDGSSNDNIIELVQIIETCINQSNAQISLILPYLPYSRQDRRFADNHSFGMQALAKMLNIFPIKRIFTCDLHNPTNKTLFKASLVNIIPLEIVTKLSANKQIILPDEGAKLRYEIKSDNFVYCHKERNEGKITLSLDGAVEGKDCLIVDDIIDSGQTLLKTASMLFENRAKSVNAYVTHGLCNNDFFSKYSKSPIKKLYITNSRYINRRNDNVEVIDIANLIASYIKMLD